MSRFMIKLQGSRQHDTDEKTEKDQWHKTEGLEIDPWHIETTDFTQ